MLVALQAFTADSITLNADFKVEVRASTLKLNLNLIDA